MAERTVQTPDERFTCQGCGRCCTMWTITLDESKADDLRRHDWVPKDAFARRAGAGDPYRIRMVQGRCLFLDEDARCRIHARAGYEAKPEGCKAFPLLVGRVAGTTHLRLSFWCPAVTAGTGKPLREQRRWVQATIRAAGAVEREAPLALRPGLEISVGELEAIEAELDGLLGVRERPIARRLAAGAGLLDRLCRATREAGHAALRGALREVSRADVEALATEGLEGGSPAHAGPVFSLFLGNDARPGALGRAGQFFRVRLFNLGLLKLRSALVEARASARAVAAVRLDEGAEGSALLERYLRHKLASRRILAGELTLVSGYNLLVAAYGVVALLARARAATNGRAATEPEDLRRAVQAADVLVMEHSALYAESMVGALTEAVLAQDRLAASILARVGAGSSCSPPTPSP